MTPNQVTWLMLITGIVGGVLFAFPSIVLSCIAFFVFQIWIILDCSDGEVARISGKKSLFGPYLDRINHFVTDIFLLGSLGVKVYIITNDSLYLFLGALLSLINIFSRLVFRAVTSTVFEYKAYENYKVEDSEEKKVESKKGIMSLIKSLVILASKIPLRRLFTATLEISFVFVVIGIFYYFYPIANMFLILLYIYLAGNSLNVIMRFIFITLNFDKVVHQAITERNI
jgi:phosphatidylglycerophosphate synthase